MAMMILIVCGCLALCVSAAAELVGIDGEFNTSRFANVEAKQIRIHWGSQLVAMPSETNDFLASSYRGLWRSALDGPADADTQVLMARYRGCGHVQLPSFIHASSFPGFLSRCSGMHLREKSPSD